MSTPEKPIFHLKLSKQLHEKNYFVPKFVFFYRDSKFKQIWLIDPEVFMEESMLCKYTRKKTLILRCSLIGWIDESGLLIGLFKFKRIGTDEVNLEGPIVSIWASICRHYNNDKIILFHFKMISSGKDVFCLITNLIEFIIIFKLAEWQL